MVYVSRGKLKPAPRRASAISREAAIPVHPISINRLLDRLESAYGPQEPGFPVDPYEFLVWWHCGYPQSEERCTRGWRALRVSVNIEPQQILSATLAQLAAALKAGGMVPELRAMRLKEIAQRVAEQFDGDLRGALAGSQDQVRTALKRFPGISDPGADRILLFAHASPVAAVPSNCPHVLVRIVHGLERENYSVTYREAQEIVEAETPRQFYDRQRAYLLLKAHGRQICKRRPLCAKCPVQADCAYAAGVDRGGRRAS
jgi:endonuclease III